MLLALDFDGVICDSMDECLYVSYFAYKGVSDVVDINLSRIPISRQIEFRKYRYLVGPGHHYYYLWKAIHERGSNNSKSFEQHFIEIVDMEDHKADAFATEFYQMRKLLRKHDQKKWIQLNQLYDQPKKALSIKGNTNNVVIVTSKDRESVHDILKENDIDIKREEIYGREFSVDKNEIFQALSVEREVDLSNISFVDDNIENLVNAKSIGIMSYLAVWGYNSDLDKLRAEDSDIKLLEVTGIEDIINDVARNTDG
jgi:phosphoglycolate phosphatase-like HAD superfamily hydrolase